MAVSLRILVLASCIGAALLSGLIVFVTALNDADNSLVAALEGKAISHALAIKQDVEIALNIGIPLQDIREVSEYLEEGAQEDDDIRFATITDLDLQRIHYGGIGRRRLDPLLAASELHDAISGDPNLLTAGFDGLVVDGFSLTAVPLTANGEPVGFVVVAVQDKQVFDELLVDLIGLLPAILGILILLAELALATTRAVFEAPLARLANLMQQVGQAQTIQRSARHDRTEIGIALLRFNGIVHRLSDRAQRVLTLADEIKRAVFDAKVANEVEQRAESLRSSLAQPLLREPQFKADARSSDIHVSLALLFAAGTCGLVVTSAIAPWSYLIWLVAGLVFGVVVVGAIRSPGWGLVLSGALQLVSAILLFRPDWVGSGLPLLGMAGGVGAAFAAALLYRRSTRACSLPWVLFRVGLGCASGGLIAWTVYVEDSADLVPWLILVGVGLAVVAANREPAARGSLFARSVRGGRN